LQFARDEWNITPDEHPKEQNWTAALLRLLFAIRFSASRWQFAEQQGSFLERFPGQDCHGTALF